MLKKILLITLLIGLCQCLFTSPSMALTLGSLHFGKPKAGTSESAKQYKKNVAKSEAIEKYERSLLPQSGYMTKEEYENLSKDIPNSDKVIPEYKLPKDIKMKYVPQPVYEIARYNNPPGSPELHIGRSYGYDRQFVCQGVASANKDFLVYPVVSFYAANQCTACDLFVIPLDTSLPEKTRILRANIIKRQQDPILSTEKDIREKYIFRTMTPIDFSPDGTKFIAKEKIGNTNDGIWKTNLWVYDFNTKTAKQISEIRQAIKYYWLKNHGLVLDEKRWDIFPLGFDANDPNRIVVSAFGYTGKTPQFLGNWSIDCNGERAMLLSLFEQKAEISMSGVKLIKADAIIPPNYDKTEKLADKLKVKQRKAEKKSKKHELKEKKNALKKELKEIDKEYSIIPNNSTPSKTLKTDFQDNK